MVDEIIPRRTSSFGRFMLIALGALILSFTLWTWFALSYAYSRGDRAGVLLKFSQKGWICKTYEGQLALYVVGGVAPQLWDFSTRDEELAKRLAAAVGQEIQLHYSEHRGVPTSCFGETPYFADNFTVVVRPRN
ncbi:MAG TPA: hypothetical protein VKB34_16190 [Povalibacter sp.]|nr:hypothetical protein [Povalibacter sp.]